MKNKYILIYDELAKEISSGLYQSQQLLPSESELTEKYSVSRETIRKALKLLSEHGYIQRIQGKGSVVLEIDKVNFPISGLVSFKELADKLGQRASTSVTTFETILPTPFLEKTLDIDSEEPLWNISRVREIDGERIILDKDVILKRTAPDLTKGICASSIYEYLEDTLALTISFAKKEITVEEPTIEDREQLDLEGFSTIVVVRNYVYLDNALLFQYTESRHRTDKFRFVDFARRNR